MKKIRYFMDCDNDGHWFLIDAEFRAEWEAFVEEASPDGWDLPDYAAALAGGPQSVEFSDPEEL